VSAERRRAADPLAQVRSRAERQIGRADLERLGPAKLRDRLANQLGMESGAFGEPRRQRRDDGLAAVLERRYPGYAGQARGDDGPGARAGQLDRRLEDDAVLDQDRAILAPPRRATQPSG